jgi:hypothetical protein
MAGASNNERVDAYIAEVTVGTTPATPAWLKMPTDTLNMTGNPRISESRLIAFQGQRSAIARNGIAVSGSLSGKMLYGEFDPFLESMFQDQWATNTLINDYEQYTFSIEQAIPAGAGSGTIHYTRFRGVEAVSAQLVATAGQDLEFTMDLLGIASDDAASAIIAGATYTDPTNLNVMGSGPDITVDFGALGYTTCIQSLTIDFGVEDKTEQLKIGSDDLCGVNRGVMRPVITGNAYVEADFLSLYNEARNGTTPFVLTVTLGTVTTEKYTLTFPACEFVEGPLQTAADGPAFQPFRILPLYDAATVGTVQIDRAVV